MRTLAGRQTIDGTGQNGTERGILPPPTKRRHMTEIPVPAWPVGFLVKFSPGRNTRGIPLSEVHAFTIIHE